MDWKGLRVLVTGGASFIGSHLVDALVERGAKVRVVDNLSSGRLENIKKHIEEGKIEFLGENLVDPAVISHAMAGMEIVFHLAADHGGRGYVDLHQVDAVGLEAAVPTLDVDGRGVDDEVVRVSSGLEEAVQPDAVAAGLVAGDERHGVIQVEAPMGRGNLALKDVEVAGGHRPDARLLAETGGEGELPGTVREFEGEIERGRFGQRWKREAGRHGHDAPPEGMAVPRRVPAAARARRVLSQTVAGATPPPA